MTWITLVGPPRNGVSIEVHDLKEGTKLIVGVMVEDCPHKSGGLLARDTVVQSFNVINVTYSHYRGNIFKSELGEGDFVKKVCHECLAEARLRVLTKQLESNKYTRKYKAELKRLAKTESEWIYDD